MRESENNVLLEARQLTKIFGSVVALESIDLELRGGELLAVIGDNGAGKSTLVKILSGALQPESGQIFHRGAETRFSSPHDARMRGIETIYQDLALASVLDVAGNLHLGREVVHRLPFLPKSLSVLNRKEMITHAAQLIADLEVSVPSVSKLAVDRLSGGQRQGVAIARAAGWASEVLFMDEPTAALGVRQSEAVLQLARRLVQRGLAVVLITHTLPHVLQHADRVVVLRQGRKVADMPCENATPEGLVSLIVGFDAATAES